jgi:outer membrane immunogenic protein
MRRHIELAFAAGIMLGLGVTGVASAADLAVKAPRSATSVYSWTGCYIGANVGAGLSRMDTTQQTTPNPAGGAPIAANVPLGREDDSGFIGGGQAGCDFQTGNLVFGVQGQADFGNVNGQHSLVGLLPAASETNALRSVGTATGRIGYLLTPTFLAYGKGGVAFMNNRNQILNAAGIAIDSASFTLPGMTVGAGLEWMFAPNWSMFAEYNYMFIEPDAAKQFNPVGDVINTRQVTQTALFGVNYKFHWEGPVVAKY